MVTNEKIIIVAIFLFKMIGSVGGYDLKIRGRSTSRGWFKTKNCGTVRAIAR